MSLCNRGLLVAFAILYLCLASFTLVSARSIPFQSVTSIHKQNLWKDSHKFTTYLAGQNYKGLSNVKRYFHEIGYNIANIRPSNFDDRFDNDLISSIKIYQKYYNLNPTGKLDHNTLTQLMTPRCGVPDFPDNMHSLHTVSHYVAFGTRWPKGTTKLQYYYYPHQLFNGTFKNAIQSAFNKWTNVMNINFEEVASLNQAQINIDAFLFTDDQSDWWAYAQQPTYGVFRLNTNATWVSSGDITKRTENRAVDVESLSLHEIGHLLGLAHSQNTSAVMYAYLEPRTIKANLTEDDIDGMKHVYNITP